MSHSDRRTCHCHLGLGVPWSIPVLSQGHSLNTTQSKCYLQVNKKTPRWLPSIWFPFAGFLFTPSRESGASWIACFSHLSLERAIDKKAFCISWYSQHKKQSYMQHILDQLFEYTIKDLARKDYSTINIILRIQVLAHFVSRKCE